MTGFCRRCGASVASGPPAVCESCGYATFVNPRPTGSIILLDADRFLTLLRVREPSPGKWDLPGGFCDGWEHPADAAVREAREELDVDVRLDRFVGMYIGEYRFQDESIPTLDCIWAASIVDGVVRPDPSEAGEHAWLPLYDPPEMAFATQDSALREAATLLRAVPRGGRP